MPPFLALLIWLILLVALLWLDPAREAKHSSSLWLAVIWIFIIGSRLPSQWFDGQVITTGASLEKGNLLDRSVFSALIFLSVGVLISRSFRWGDFCARNTALITFLLFALASVCWSDYPFISLKHWFRDLGNYLVILVVLSESRPAEAFHTVLRRLCYLLIPLSIVLIKYYPELSKQYDSWTGVASYAGVATSKNTLGAACLISGLFFFWDTLVRWPNRRAGGTKRIIWVNLAFMSMTLWLLKLANSATSNVCLALGWLVIFSAHTRIFQRNSRVFKGLIPLCLCLSIVLVFAFNMNADLARMLERDATFTDRTKIWSSLIGMHTNPLIGTGYQSFWLGPRLDLIWQAFRGINESHNGYLEIYLNLGIIGLLLLGLFLIVSYRTIWQNIAAGSKLAYLTLAAWTILVVYNITESAFFGGLLWLALLSGAIRVPVRAKAALRTVGAPLYTSGAANGITGLLWK